MRPLTHCREPVLSEAPILGPRFWRVTYTDLVTMWGEQGALRMLRGMERAYEQQVPAPAAVQPGPCAEPDQTFSRR